MKWQVEFLQESYFPSQHEGAEGQTGIFQGIFQQNESIGIG